MAGLTKLGLALIFVFVLFLLVVTAQFTYVFWYRRRFQREAPGADDPEVAAAATGDPYGSPSSKELLLYFICLRNQQQNERALATVTPIYAFPPSAPGFSWPPRGSAVPDAKPLPSLSPPPPPPPFLSMLPAELEKWGDAYAPQDVFTVAGGVKDEAGEEEPAVSAEEAVVSAGEAAGEEQKEEEVMAEEGVVEVALSTTPGCSSRFYTAPVSPAWGTEAGWELELCLEADGSSSDEEGFLSSDEKLPAE